MTKERALRRAERERAAAARAEQRVAQAAREARRRARRQALVRWLPRRRPATGVLAQRRQVQNRAVYGIALVVQVLGWLAFGSVRASVLVLVLTAFALPVVFTLAFDRRG
jgi:Flp pilus assembly protein TadB